MRLLYALDLKEKKSWLLDEASAWARRLGATIDVVYVDPFDRLGAYVLDNELHDRLLLEYQASRRALRDQVHQVGESLAEDVRGQSFLMGGHPVDRVVELAANYDAVLVGTHGRKALSRMLLGSVAENIVRRSPVTTIVLRRGQGAGS